MVIQSILVIADRIDSHTEMALQRAIDISPNRNTKIKLVGFVHEAFVEAGQVLSQDEAETYRQKIITRRTKELESVVKKLPKASRKAECEVVWEKEIAKWVVAYNQKEKVDLVIKTGNRSETLWYMPTDWKLLRDCRTPVYLVARKSWRKRGAILATVDIDSKSKSQQQLNEKVLQYAADQAKQANAELHLSYVINVSQVLADIDLVDTKKIRKSFQEKSYGKLIELAGRYGIDEDRVHVSSGTPYKKIPSLANKLKADLVVMGGIGRKGVKGALLGNTAEQVISLLRTDVLVIKPNS